MLFWTGGVGEVVMCCLSALSSETMKQPVRGKAGQRAHHSLIIVEEVAAVGHVSNIPSKQKGRFWWRRFPNDVMVKTIEQSRRNDVEIEKNRKIFVFALQ